MVLLFCRVRSLARLADASIRGPLPTRLPFHPRPRLPTSPAAPQGGGGRSSDTRGVPYSAVSRSPRRGLPAVSPGYAPSPTTRALFITTEPALSHRVRPAEQTRMPGCTSMIVAWCPGNGSIELHTAIVEVPDHLLLLFVVLLGRMLPRSVSSSGEILRRRGGRHIGRMAHLGYPFLGRTRMRTPTHANEYPEGGTITRLPSGSRELTPP